MKILIACEESQTATKAFRAFGHEAYSCDIKPCSGGHPEWHIQRDVLEQIDKEWDMIIAHPPCTFISNAGACRLYPKAGHLDVSRFNKGLEAKEFFMKLYNAPCKKVVIENPIPLSVYNLPPYSQIVQPYEYGHPYSKKTCLWIKGLPLLRPTKIITENIISWVSGGSKDCNGNPRKNKGTNLRSSLMRSKSCVSKHYRP